MRYVIVIGLLLAATPTLADEADTLDRASGSTVFIHSAKSSGSGVVIADTPPGAYVLTALHVVSHPWPMMVAADAGGEDFPCVVNRKSTWLDLAVCFVPGYHAPAPLLGKNPRKFTRVYVLGHPLSQPLTISAPMLANAAHVHFDADNHLRPFLELTDGYLAPGTSGAPVFDADGHLIGIVDELHWHFFPVEPMGRFEMPIFQHGYAVRIQEVRTFLKGLPVKDAP